jgi:hypothetical protein
MREQAGSPGLLLRIPGARDESSGQRGTWIPVECRMGTQLLPSSTALTHVDIGI